MMGLMRGDVELGELWCGIVMIDCVRCCEMLRSSTMENWIFGSASKFRNEWDTTKQVEDCQWGSFGASWFAALDVDHCLSSNLHRYHQSLLMDGCAKLAQLYYSLSQWNAIASDMRLFLMLKLCHHFCRNCPYSFCHHSANPWKANSVMSPVPELSPNLCAVCMSWVSNDLPAAFDFHHEMWKSPHPPVSVSGQLGDLYSSSISGGAPCIDERGAYRKAEVLKCRSGGATRFGHYKWTTNSLYMSI